MSWIKLIKNKKIILINKITTKLNNCKIYIKKTNNALKEK